MFQQCSGVCECEAGPQDTIDSDGDTVPDCVDVCPGEDDLAVWQPHRGPVCQVVTSVPAAGWPALIVLAIFLLGIGTWLNRWKSL